MNVRTILVGLVLLVPASAAVATAPACMPTVEKGWIRAAPPGTTMLAGYAVVKNRCAKAVAVTDVASPDFAMAMIHETVQQNGMSRMRHARSTVVQAGGELRFAPGGLHLMLMHPERALKAGDKVRLTLELADGRRLPAQLVVRATALP